MAGSITTFAYTSDEGVEYNINLDRSNAIAAGGLAGKSAAAEAAGAFLKASSKRPLQPRYIIASLSGDDNVKRRVVVTDPASAVWLSATQINLEVNGAVEVFDITAKIGEQRFLLPSTDTGQPL